MSSPSRKSMSDKVGSSIMSSMKAVGSSVGEVGGSIVAGAKMVADVPGKVVDGVVDGLGPGPKVSSFDRKKSKGDASFSRLEEGKSKSSAGYAAGREPPRAPADGGDIMSKMRASLPSSETASAKFDGVRHSLGEAREKLEDRMTSKTLGTKLACYRLAPVPLGATLAALLALPYALAQFAKLWLLHAHGIVRRLFELTAGAPATRGTAPQGAPLWRVLLCQALYYAIGAATILVWFASLAVYLLLVTAGTAFLVGREAFDESTLFKLSRESVAEGAKDAVGESLHDSKPSAVQAPPDVQSAIAAKAAFKAARRDFAKGASAKYGGAGRSLLLLGDWALLSGVAPALRVVDDLLVEAKPLFGAIGAALDVLVAATEKVAAAQEELGLLKKTGGTVDEVTTEPQKEMEQGAAHDAAAKPLVELKAKVTEEVTKAWEGFHAKRNAKRAEGKGGPPAASAEVVEEEAEEGLKKIFPKTEPAMANVVGYVTIPLALVGGLVAFSSSSTEALLFVASATVFA